MTPADLALVHTAPTSIPEAPREPLRTAAWIAAQIFDGERSPRWVLRHAPRVQLSAGVVRFFESQVRAWITTRCREGAT